MTPPDVVLTIPRPQHTILCSLARFGVLSAPQLTRWGFGSSQSFVMQHCTKLLESRHIRFTPLASPRFKPGGRDLRIYSLASKGVTYLKRAGVEPIYARLIREQSPLRHAIGCNDLVILSRQLAAADPRFQLRDFATEFDLKRLQSAHRFVPDAYTELLVDDYSLPIVWEFDRSTEGSKFLRAKISALAYFVNGAYRELFSVDSITVALVSQTERRHIQLLRLTEQVLEELGAQVIAPNFLLAAFDPSTADPLTVFTTEYWQQPFAASRTSAF